MFLKIRGAKVFKSLQSRAIRANLAFESRAIRCKKGANRIILPNLKSAIRHKKIAKGASKDIAC